MLSLRCLPLALLTLALSGCAVSGGTDSASSPPPLADRAWDSPIRENMRPEHRVFYDMLDGQGDWTLIEPYGYVFRPDVNFVAWRPYQNGYWVPSDSWGWVWVSSDEFGWATDHYGRWLNDRFQGWVWAPDVVWAPAWVQWAGDDSYVGWAPLLAAASSYDTGAYTFVPVGALAATDLSARIVKPELVGGRLADIKPIDRVIERDGVKVAAGPRIEAVERHTGALKRVQLQDLVPPGALTRGAPVSGGAARPAREPAEREADRAAQQARADAQRAAGRAADEARDRTKTGAPAPDRVPIVRPFESGAKPRGDARPGAPARDERPRRGAAADSTR